MILKESSSNTKKKQFYWS